MFQQIREILSDLIRINDEILFEIGKDEVLMDVVEELVVRRTRPIIQLQKVLHEQTTVWSSEAEKDHLKRQFDKYHEQFNTIQPVLTALQERLSKNIVAATTQRRAQRRYDVVVAPDISYING
jgi:hypothetical protein